MVASPWNIVGLVIAIAICTIAATVIGGLLKVLVYRPERKPELEKLPRVPQPKLLTSEAAEPTADPEPTEPKEASP